MKPGQFSLTNLTVLRPLRQLVEPFWVPSCDERGSEERFDSGAPVRSNALQPASGLSIRYSVSPYAESSGRGAACCNLESVVQSPLLLAMDDSSRDARRVPSTARQCSVEPCWLRQPCRPVSYCSHSLLGPDLGPSVCGSAQWLRRPDRQPAAGCLAPGSLPNIVRAQRRHGRYMTPIRSLLVRQVLALMLSQATTPVGSKQAGATHWSAENE